MRENKILPLPSKTTIARYLKSSKSETGFYPKFFTNLQRWMLEIEAKFPGSSFGTLIFEEMSVKPAVGIDVKHMKFNGLVDFGKTITTDESSEKTLQDRAADHALVFMFFPP